MNVILFGASGLLGSNIARTAQRRGHAVTAIAGRTIAAIPGASQVVHCDITDEYAVQRCVLEAFPDAIINAAAVAEPAQCDADPGISRRINVDLPAALAQLAHHVGARMVHFSSEQVFDGTAAPYADDAPQRPPNLYARQKAESERLVSQHAPASSVTLRLPLLAGNSLPGTRSLHERLFGLWASGKRARLYRDEIRQPCTAENAAEVAIEMIERNDLPGTFNWAGADSISRAEIGRRIALHFGLPAAELIEEAAQADDPSGAHRQPDLSLKISALAGRLKTAPESFEQVLDRLVVPPPYREWFRNRI